MQYWFSKHTGDWNEAKIKQNLSEGFKNEITSLTTQLSLKPVKGSPKSGIATYPGIGVTVQIKKFTFDDFASVMGEDGKYYTPVLKFDLVVMAKKSERVARGESDMEIIYKGPMTVTYLPNYPRDYPTFKLPKYGAHLMGAHEHHMYAGGRMCLYDGYGYSDSDWDPTRDTAATAFGPAMRWIVWHERDRKRGVDADDINRRRHTSSR